MTIIGHSYSLVKSSTKCAPALRRDGSILSCPYDGSISIDFDDASLAVYCSRWETPDGKPIDLNISCYMMRYDEYRKNRGG